MKIFKFIAFIILISVTLGSCSLNKQIVVTSEGQEPYILYEHQER